MSSGLAPSWLSDLGSPRSNSNSNSGSSNSNGLNNSGNNNINLNNHHQHHNQQHNHHGHNNIHLNKGGLHHHHNNNHNNLSHHSHSNNISVNHGGGHNNNDNRNSNSNTMNNTGNNNNGNNTIGMQMQQRTRPGVSNMGGSSLSNMRIGQPSNSTASNSRLMPNAQPLLYNPNQPSKPPGMGGSLSSTPPQPYRPPMIGARTAPAIEKRDPPKPVNTFDTQFPSLGQPAIPKPKVSTEALKSTAVWGTTRNPNSGKYDKGGGGKAGLGAKPSLKLVNAKQRPPSRLPGKTAITAPSLSSSPTTKPSGSGVGLLGSMRPQPSQTRQPDSRMPPDSRDNNNSITTNTNNNNTTNTTNNNTNNNNNNSKSTTNKTIELNTMYQRHL